MSTHFAILGATGDLTARYLMPALAALRDQKLVEFSSSILCIGYDDWDQARFRTHIEQALAKFAPTIDADVRAATVAALDYHQADVTKPDQLAAALGRRDGPLAVYLALPPTITAQVLKGLAEVELPPESRIVIEKPFGHDLATAEALNDLIRPNFAEKYVFRIDHFLGKQTAQNILGLRFANRVFESLWNRDHIDKIEITWDESVALEGRAGYYDKAGALKDMVQNHLLQLLCLVAMEAPLSFNERDFRDRKVDVLRAVRRFTPEVAKEHTIRGRYTAGRVGDRQVPNYVDEPGVDPARKTETYAQATLFINNWRWAGVPFVLRTGKALSRPWNEITVHFKPVPHLAFEGDGLPKPNILRLTLNPDRMELGINLNAEGDPFDLERITLATELAPQELSAYGKLIMDILDGNAVLSIRGDEAEESWRIVEPILAAWADPDFPILDYPAGSTGPASAPIVA